MIKKDENFIILNQNNKQITIEEAAECRKQAESKYGFYETHGSYKA